MVQRGDTGPAVGQLQERLSKLGYGVAPSNQFGPQTESQLKTAMGTIATVYLLSAPAAALQANRRGAG